MEKFIEISGQVYKMIGLGWELNTKDLVNSFEHGRNKYYERCGKYPTHAYVHESFLVKLHDEIMKYSFGVEKISDPDNPPPAFPLLMGVELESKDWVLPNIVYFSTEN